MTSSLHLIHVLGLHLCLIAATVLHVVLLIWRALTIWIVNWQRVLTSHFLLIYLVDLNTVTFYI